MRERLIRLLGLCHCDGGEELGNCPYRKHGVCAEIYKIDYCAIQNLADHLIANGVEIPVHCCDCASCKVIRDNVGAGHWHCKKMYGFPEVDPTDFCSRGERREGE